MDFFARLEGAFFSPRETLRAVAEKPLWLDVLAVTLGVLVLYTILVMPFASREALAHYQTEGGAPPDISQMPKWLLIIPVVGGLMAMMIILFFNCGIIFLAGRIFSSQGDFKKILAVYLHAGLVDGLLGNAVRLAVALLKKTALVSTGPAMFFPGIEARSFLFLALGPFDFFRLWMFGILAYGLSAVFKVDLKKALLISFLSWFLISLVSFGLGGLGMLLSRR